MATPHPLSLSYGKHLGGGRAPAFLLKPSECQPRPAHPAFSTTDSKQGRGPDRPRSLSTVPSFPWSSGPLICSA